MALKIIDSCIGCGACEPECPNNAIHEGIGGLYVINPRQCTECLGFYAVQQCVAACPVESCVQDNAYAETPEELALKFQRLYPGKNLTNTEHWRPPVF